MSDKMFGPASYHHARVALIVADYNDARRLNMSLRQEDGDHGPSANGQVVVLTPGMCVSGFRFSTILITREANDLRFNHPSLPQRSAADRWFREDMTTRLLPHGVVVRL